MRYLMIAALLLLVVGSVAQLPSGKLYNLTVTNELELESTAMEDFLSGLTLDGGAYRTFFYPATIIAPIDHDIAFTGFGFVPYIAVDTTWSDSTTIYLNFLAPDGFRDSTVVPQISFDVLVPDTMIPGDAINLWVFQLQGDAQMMPVDTASVNIAITAPADSILPGIYETPFYDLEPALYEKHALAIRREADDVLAQIGILGMTIRVPRIP